MPDNYAAFYNSWTSLVKFTALSSLMLQLQNQIVTLTRGNITKKVTAIRKANEQACTRINNETMNNCIQKQMKVLGLYLQLPIS